MIVQSIQPTPNPNAFKFLVDVPLAAGQTMNFSSAEDAVEHDLAKSMFAVAGVDTLFFCENFVTVAMTSEADWRSVAEEITKILEAAEGPEATEASEAGAPMAQAQPAAPNLEGADEELWNQIQEVLDDRVRPALAGDGGGLEVVALDGKTLHIRYQGACGTCPSSIQGTLIAIQNMLQSEVDEQLMVVTA